MLTNPQRLIKSKKRAEVDPRQTGSLTSSTVKRRSLVDLSPSRTLQKSDNCEIRGSKVGSDLSRVGERRRLESWSKNLNWILRTSSES